MRISVAEVVLEAHTPIPSTEGSIAATAKGDRRHVFNLTSVAQTPQFANNTLRMIATGWRISGIYRKSSGSFLTITSGVDRALTGISSQRAQQVLENPYGDKSLTNYLNPAAFTLPALGTLGNMGLVTLRGREPGSLTWRYRDPSNCTKGNGWKLGQKLTISPTAFDQTIQRAL